jgi:rhodanese-related sulfurtransferase
MIENLKENNELIILDVRTKDEYRSGCVEQSLNINFNDPNFHDILRLINKTKMYLVYCQSGIRSKKTVIIMSNLGFKKVYHMYEGIEGWKELQMELVDP